jgi:hypothetical protein
VILPHEASQCSKCGNPAEFGYTVQGITQWFCATHRLAQNYADARLPKVSEGKQPTNDELKDELAGRAGHIRKILRCERFSAAGAAVGGMPSKETNSRNQFEVRD